MRFLVAGRVLLSLAGALVSGQTPAASPERDFLTRPRRLTVEGRRAGEGYWSQDGKKLVFQSEREPGNPFYQIYTLDMATGDVARISPGMGKTTCSFFHPETGDVLFASTHHDPRIEAAAGRGAGVPRLGPGASLLVGLRPRDGALRPEREDAARYRRLTNARGYDAEASYSPDGQWIAFSSTRQAYERELSARRAQAARDRPELLRRDLHHARRWDGERSG